MRMEHSENFKAVLEEKTREAESIIAAFLPKEEGFAKKLAKAMNYSMTAGRKEASSAAFAGEFPSVRRNRGGCKTIYGSHGDDSHPFPDPR